MATIDGMGPKARTVQLHPGLPYWGQGPKYLNHPPYPPGTHQQGAELEAGQPGSELMP